MPFQRRYSSARCLEDTRLTKATEGSLGRASAEDFGGGLRRRTSAEGFGETFCTRKARARIAVMGQPIAIACSLAFRDQVLALAARRRVSVGDLLRAVAVLLPLQAFEEVADPGEPPLYERDTVVVKSGTHKGATLKRKPRLQVRLKESLSFEQDPPTLRKALALALALEKQEWALSLEKTREREQRKTRHDKTKQLIAELERGIERLAFRPLVSNCSTLEDACYIFGLRPSAHPSEELVRQRFRDLAAVFHPDAIKGDHERMSQLNQAMQLFKDYNILSS